MFDTILENVTSALIDIIVQTENVSQQQQILKYTIFDTLIL